jgi:adenylate cyclase
MRDLVGSFLAASLAKVHRYGGTAPQFTGDGFMALFGAPITQEDDVRRALLGCHRHAERAIGRHGIRPPCRVAKPVISASARTRPTQWIIPY